MAFTNYYASTSGSGAHDGSSAANEWTLAELVTATNALGAGGAAARHVHVKGNHTGRGAADTFTVGGTNQSPFWISFYVATPGDLDYVQYDIYGRINTSVMCSVAYNAGNYRVTPAQYTVINGMNHSTSYNGDGFRTGGGGDVTVYNCAFSNANTGANADAFYFGASNNRLMMSAVAGPASGGSAAVVVATGANHIIGCEITCPGAPGIAASGSSTTNIVSSVISGCTIGFSASHAATVVLAFNSTIYGCSGDGIDIISTSTGRHAIYGCHITDNGGYGIDFNGGTSGGYATFGHNRFRDNTSGNVNGYADWTTATSFAHVTTDTGGASTDFADVGNLDFRLISAAPGRRTGLGYYANIGACGDNVSGGGGGAMVIGG